MHSPTNIEEVQKLNDRLASLSRFLSKLTGKAKPFYRMLRKIESFLWDEACEQAFLDFKKTIATPPVLIQPMSGAPLVLYLLLAKEAIGSVVVQEDEKHQIPIYFASRVIHDAEKRYQMIEKVASTLITSVWCYRHFQTHHTDHPIRQVLRKLDLAGIMVVWSVELLEFDLQYEPYDPMKTYFMADFLAEFVDNVQANSD